MKVITVQPPYAQAIALEFKHYETRRTRILRSVVGQRIAIHCGKDMREFEDRRDGLNATPIREASVTIEYAFQREGISLFDAGYWRDTAGCILCTAIVDRELVIRQWTRNSQAVLERACGYWIEGYYAYSLCKVEVLDKPIPARGRLGLWEWSNG